MLTHIPWSSEYNDSELGLVYYNYRHYNPADGRWTGRDPLAEGSSANVYCAVYNNPLISQDQLGLYVILCFGRSKFFSVKSLSSEQSTLASQVKQRWIHGIEARLLSAPQPSGEASLV